MEKIEINTTFTIYPSGSAFDIEFSIKSIIRDESRAIQVVVVGVIVGVVLSLPNIILQIVRRCKSQMTS